MYAQGVGNQKKIRILGVPLCVLVALDTAALHACKVGQLLL